MQRNYLSPGFVILAALAAVLAAHGIAWAQSAPAPHRYFRIHVVDDQTHRGVPLVELRTVQNTRYVTDSNGTVAFYEPGLMNEKVFFFVQSHGYEFPQDKFGYRGKALAVSEGGSAELKIHRINIAQRLYRITGVGIYADSMLLGDKVPLRQPLINGLVAGQDTNMAAVWNGKIYWFWGDTNWPQYPLGHFKTSGATSLLPGHGGLDPRQGIDLKYFVNEDGHKKGFSREMAPMPGPGLIWIDGLMVVPDEKGRLQLVAHYVHHQSLHEVTEHGMLIFDEKTQTFTPSTVFDLKDRKRCPQDQAFLVHESDSNYYFFTSPFAVTRVKADLAHVLHQANYETFTCLTPGSRYCKENSSVERTSAGKLIYGWKSNTDPLGTTEEQVLIAAGKIRPEEAHYQIQTIADQSRASNMHSAKNSRANIQEAQEANENLSHKKKIAHGSATHATLKLHKSSICWNAFLKKWIMIAVQHGGQNSQLGEIWFLTANSPTGPWRDARLIVTHDDYTFYNPVQHDFFDQEGGRIIYFEGTYTNRFSTNTDPTPRYNYNQIMYSLDLSDPRLKLRR